MITLPSAVEIFKRLSRVDANEELMARVYPKVADRLDGQAVDVQQFAGAFFDANLEEGADMTSIRCFELILRNLLKYVQVFTEDVDDAISARRIVATEYHV